ncbi:MAG: HalD/BesD family halogenase, partial [Hyphomicrobiaceae bacterium]
MPAFENNLAWSDRVLPEREWIKVQEAVERLRQPVRSYLPIHKKGGTIGYRDLCNQAPEIVELYHSRKLQDLLCNIVGARVFRTPLHDQSSCSLLTYEQPGDHINWHYDHNFYKGRHFTVLIPVVNSGTSENSCSSAQLIARIKGADQIIPTPPNSMIVFEGARLLHKVTPIRKGERRVMLSMTFCELPANSWLQEAARRIKDTAF